jgi:MFS family permease
VRPGPARGVGSPARALPRLLAAAGALAVLGILAIDIAAVPVVLPAMRVDLGSSSSGIVWVQDAYLLALAVTLLVVVRTRADRRMLAAVGVAALAGGALLASTADDTATVVTGRAVQGIGLGGLLVPALESLCPGAAERWMLGLAGAGALVVLAVGPLLGGAVTEGSSWLWLFRIELAAAVPALLLVALKAQRVAIPGRGGGTAALAAGLVLSVTGLVQSGPWGWGSADTLALLAAGATLVAFGLRDRPADGEPAILVLAGCLAAGALVAPQYLELVRGLSPVRSGLLTTVLTLSAATLAASVWLIRRRVPPRLPLVGGLACATLGALGMTRIDPASGYALVVISLGLLGSGLGAAAGAMATRGGGARLAPAAAAGAALVVAAAGALLQRAQLEEREGGGSFEDALAAGLAASGWLIAALLAGAALLAWRGAEGQGGRASGAARPAERAR